MGKGLGDSDPYMESMPDLPVKELPSRLPLMARATKDLEAEQLDYDSILNGERTGHPSMRDQEYLEHSSLFGKWIFLRISGAYVGKTDFVESNLKILIQMKKKQVIFRALRAGQAKLGSIFSRSNQKQMLPYQPIATRRIRVQWATAKSKDALLISKIQLRSAVTIKQLRNACATENICSTVPGQRIPTRPADRWTPTSKVSWHECSAIKTVWLKNTTATIRWAAHM